MNQGRKALVDIMCHYAPDGADCNEIEDAINRFADEIVTHKNVRTIADFSDIEEIENLSVNASKDHQPITLAMCAVARELRLIRRAAEKG
jgi:hypothetical protein